MTDLTCCSHAVGRGKARAYVCVIAYVDKNFNMPSLLPMYVRT